MTHDVKAFLPLTPLEFRVLLVLANGALHGYAIAKEVERTDPGLGKIYPTNLYRRLQGMAGDGLIDEVPGADDDARRSRHFGITALGERVARAEASRLEAALVEARRAFGTGD